MVKKPEGILIVDDEESVRRLLNNKLSAEGYQCYEAANALQALDELHHNKIGLVMLDIKMPGRSGIELLPEIKSVHSDISVIMITATDDMHTAIQCMKQGAYHYITKPFELDEITISATRALEKRRLELENKEYQHHLEEKVAEQANKIRASFLNAITALVYALEAKDAYTSGHSQRVTDYATSIGGTLGLSAHDLNVLRYAAQLHDIGKIGITEDILHKPGPLDDGEWQIIRSHPVISERIIQPLDFLKEIRDVVRHHHERLDGSGYPDALAGDDIPMLTRILGVADAYDAMTSRRPYRTRALSPEQAMGEIVRCQGSQFDPRVVAALAQGDVSVEPGGVA